MQVCPIFASREHKSYRHDKLSLELENIYNPESDVTRRKTVSIDAAKVSLN